MKGFVLTNGFKFNNDSWQSLYDVLNGLFSFSIPIQLLKKENLEAIKSIELKNGEIENILQNEDADFDIAKQENYISSGENKFKIDELDCIHKCSTHLLLLGLVKEIISKFLLNLNATIISSFLGLLETSFSFAEEFNQNIEHRYTIWKNGFLSKLQDIPSLHRQQKEGLWIYLNMLFQLYNLKKSSIPVEFAYTYRVKLINNIKRITNEYVTIQREYHIISRIFKEKKSGIDFFEVSKFKEITRILKNMSPIISDSIIEKMVKVNLNDVFNN